MRWRWPWQRDNGHDARMIREAAERQLADIQRRTPGVEQAASAMAALPEYEFARRVRWAFRRQARPL